MTLVSIGHSVVGELNCWGVDEEYQKWTDRLAFLICFFLLIWLQVWLYQTASAGQALAAQAMPELAYETDDERPQGIRRRLTTFVSAGAMSVEMAGAPVADPLGAYADRDTSKARSYRKLAA